MNTLRKRPTFDDMYNLNQPKLKLPARKGLRAINDPIISNLLFDDTVVDDVIIQQRKKDINTATIMRDQFTQTNRLENGTQTDFGPDAIEEGYKREPHLYDVYPAFSKQPWDRDFFKSKLFKRREKNNAYSETFDTQNNKLKDTGFQTSTYIPSSLTNKRDNINQTFRYVLRIDKPPSPPPSPRPPPSPPPSEGIEPTPPPTPTGKKKLPSTPDSTPPSKPKSKTKLTESE